MLGTHIGPYRIVRHLGAGGYGEVWEGRTLGSMGFEQSFALKVLLPQKGRDYDAAVRELVDEANALASLHHPSIVRVVDVRSHRRTDGGLLDVLVMELARGLTLERLLDHEGALTPAEALLIIDPLVSALEHMHGSTATGGPLLHRDLKPSNVMVSQVPAITLLDFGLARFTSRLAASTRGNRVRGTVGYMSPRRLMGRPPTPEDDLYSVGTVLFEMLTGTPFIPLRRSLKAHLEAARSPSLAERMGVLQESLRHGGLDDARRAPWTALLAAFLRQASADPRREHPPHAVLLDKLQAVHRPWNHRASLGLRVRRAEAGEEQRRAADEESTGERRVSDGWTQAVSIPFEVGA